MPPETEEAMSQHKDESTHDGDRALEDAEQAAEGSGPEVEPVTERGRLDNEDLNAPKGDQVLDRDQISQVNDPNLKR